MRPSIRASHRAFASAASSIVPSPPPLAAAEDFAYFLDRVPGAFILVGAGILALWRSSRRRVDRVVSGVGDRSDFERDVEALTNETLDRSFERIEGLVDSVFTRITLLAVEKRSSEVWQLLGTVKTEFGKFGDILAKTKKKLQEASNTIDSAQVRTRVITRKLSKIQDAPLDGQVADTKETSLPVSPMTN